MWRYDGARMTMTMKAKVNERYMHRKYFPFFVDISHLNWWCAVQLIHLFDVFVNIDID